jgi:hypothetical protein
VHGAEGSEVAGFSASGGPRVSAVSEQAEVAEERHASWLELFFDLTVVAAAAQIAHRLHGVGTVCDHLTTVGHPDVVIGRVRSFVDKQPHPGAEWLVESA